jgi:L-arginine dehydrogenase
MQETGSPVILDGASVEKLLPRLDVLAELRVLFRALGEGKAVQPSQTVTEFPSKDGDFISYLGAIETTGLARSCRPI